MPPQTAGYIVLTLKAHKEGDQYASECAELGVGSCGSTLDEAFEAIKDATLVYLETLEDEGELERVFAERGITIIPGEPPAPGGEIAVRARPEEYVSPETIRIPVPA